MPVVVRTWPVWLCFTARLLCPAHDAPGQSPTPSESARLTDFFLQTREARLAGDQKVWLERGQRLLQLAPDHPDFVISVARACGTGTTAAALADVAGAGAVERLHIDRKKRLAWILGPRYLAASRSLLRRHQWASTPHIALPFSRRRWRA